MPFFKMDASGRIAATLNDNSSPHNRAFTMRRVAKRKKICHAVSMPDTTYSLDLEAYFARIGYAGPRVPTLETLHAITGHQAATIPWESLDVLLGRPISLDPAAVERKLIHERRGGYCFEQNQLLLLVLQAIGFRVTPLSARVRWQRPKNVISARTHLFVRVELAGETWITDLGVGGVSLTAAIRLHEAGEQRTPHDARRIVREEQCYVHQVRFDREWLDVCEFTGEEMPVIDRELANWWTSASPQSRFRQTMGVARGGLDGSRRTLRDREFTCRFPDGRVEQRTIATPEELLQTLAEEFGLHFPAGTRFGPPGSPWPS